MGYPTAKYIPLKQCVAEALDEQQKSMGDFDRAWIIGFRALKKMNYQIYAEPKTVRLPVLPNKTVILPPDYISWTKIGILNNLGEVSSLKNNNALSILRDNNPNRLSYLTPDVTTSFNLIFGIPFFLNYFDNGLYYNLFGVGGGLITYGDFRVDERNNVIILDLHFQYSELILEYISSPEKDVDYMVDGALEEAVIAFIKWKLGTGPRQEFYGEVTEARRSLVGKKVTLQNINEVLRAATGMYLKA
jgi:hypothetical protein